MKKDFPHEPPPIIFTTVPPPTVLRPRMGSTFWGRVRPSTILNSQSRPEGWIVASGVVPDSGSHAESPFSKPNITIEITASQQESMKDAESSLGSGDGPSIPSLQASGNANVVKGGMAISITVSGTAKLNRGRRNVRIITPPWHGLRDVVRIVAGRKFLKDVIEPTMADVDYEYYEAIIDGNDRQARAIKWFGLVRIALVVLISPILRFFEKLRSIAG